MKTVPRSKSRRSETKRKAKDDTYQSCTERLGQDHGKSLQKMEQGRSKGGQVGRSPMCHKIGFF